MLYMGGTYLHYYPCEWMARRINLLFPFLFCQFGIIIISTELISITGRIQSVLSFRFPLPGCSFIALSSSSLSSVISWATSVVILDQPITITSHRNLTGWPAIKVIAYWSRPLDNCSQRGSNNFIETFQGSCQLWPGIGGTVSRSNRIATLMLQLIVHKSGGWSLIQSTAQDVNGRTTETEQRHENRTTRHTKYSLMLKYFNCIFSIGNYIDNSMAWALGDGERERKGRGHKKEII